MWPFGKGEVPPPPQQNEESPEDAEESFDQTDAGSQEENHDKPVDRSRFSRRPMRPHLSPERGISHPELFKRVVDVLRARIAEAGGIDIRFVNPEDEQLRSVAEEFSDRGTEAVDADIEHGRIKTHPSFSSMVDRFKKRAELG